MKKILKISIALAILVLNACEDCEVCKECIGCSCENSDDRFPEGNYVLLKNIIYSLNEQNASLVKKLT